MTTDAGLISNGFDARIVVKRTFIEVVEDEDEEGQSGERGGKLAGLARRARSESALYDMSRLAPSDESDLDHSGSDAEEAEDASPAKSAAVDETPTRFTSFDSSLEYSTGSAASGPPSPALDFVPQDVDQVPALGDISLLMSENARLNMENQLLWEQARLLGQFQEAHDMLMPHGAGCAPPASAVPSQAPHMDVRGSMASEPRGKCPSGQQQDKGEVPVAERTTVMLRNIPNNYTRAMLLAMLDEEGFSGGYDFLYLPIDFNSGACLGYAFVNLADPGYVESFWRAFDGYSRWILPSRKVCRVSWSGPHQGLEAHVARYRNSPVMHDSVADAYKPVLFSQGYRVAFPGPSKAPRAPRVRHRDNGAGRRQRAGR